MFLEKCVYQGSSGKVYPLPFTDRIAEKAVARKWKAVWLENEFLRVLVLPEIGGRIHRIVDKSTGFDLNHHISPGKKQWTWGNADVAAFYTKWLREVMESQRSSGVFPGFSPFQVEWDFGSAWYDAGVICPWPFMDSYVYYGQL